MLNWDPMRTMSVTAVTLLTAGLFATLAAPTALGDHCDARLTVYGRSGFSPQPAPLYAKTTSSMCSEVGEDSAVGAHTLSPNADQVFVRIGGDFGGSVRTVRVELTGLGFDRSSFVLNRTQSALGGAMYETREWLFMPAPAAGGELVATAFYPEGPMRVTYRASPVFLPIPQPPPATVALELVEDLRQTPLPPSP